MPTTERAGEEREPTVRLRFGQEVILDCGPEWGGDHTLYVGFIERTESMSVNGGFVNSGASREYVLQDGMDAGWADAALRYAIEGAPE